MLIQLKKKNKMKNVAGRRGWPTKLIFVKRHSKRYTCLVFVANAVHFGVVVSRYILNYFRSIHISNETAAGSIPRILFHSISRQSKSCLIENPFWTAILLQQSFDFFSIQQSLSFCLKKKHKLLVDDFFFKLNFVMRFNWCWRWEHYESYSIPNIHKGIPFDTRIRCNYQKSINTHTNYNPLNLIWRNHKSFWIGNWNNWMAQFPHSCILYENCVEKSFQFFCVEFFCVLPYNFRTSETMH